MEINSATLVVYRNISSPGNITSGSFDPPVSYSFPIPLGNYPLYVDPDNYNVAMFCADINLDGLEDIVVSQSSQNSSWVTSPYRTQLNVFSNNYAGSINYSNVIVQSSMDLTRPYLWVGNFNMDNKPDVFKFYIPYAAGNRQLNSFRNSNSTGGAITSGSLTSAFITPTTSAEPFPQLVDWNLDNKNDILLGSMLRQNNVTGILYTASDIGSNISTGFTEPAMYATPKAIGDFNGDGKPDAAGFNTNSGIIEIVQNTYVSGAISASSFGTSMQYPTYNGAPAYIEAGDVDGDGKPDIVFINSSGNLSVMRNQMASTGAILNIGVVTGSVGTTINLPVTASQLTDVTSFQFTINYNPAKLGFLNTSGWAAGVNASAVQVNDNGTGQITFVYNDVSFNIASGTFFNLSFSVLNSATGTTPVSWGDVPTPREFSNSVPNILTITYNNGSVITVGSLYSISGNITYDNILNTPMTTIPVVLKNSSGTPISSTTTNASGQYSFSNLPNGIYTVEPSTTKPWGGVTSMDITIYKKHIGNIPGYILTGLRLQSGDVNASSSLTSVDLTLIKQRIGTQISSFTAGDWMFESGSVTLSGANITKNIKAICSGDGNGSDIP